MISNYYQTLELTPKATSHQIAAQYQKLAIRYHPKTSTENPLVAAHHFNALAQAFEVLSDPVKRAFFDKYGYQALKEGLFAQGQLAGGYRFGSNANQIFENFFKSKEQSDKVLDLQVSKQASLFGHAFGGLDYKQSKIFQNLIVKVGCTLEQLYCGTSKIVEYDCKILNSDGRSTSSARCSKLIHIKPGYSGKTVLQFPGEGHQTVHGTATNLYLEIVELHHKHYTRKGYDLVYTHTLPLADALSCSTIQLNTLDFRSISVSLDSIVSPSTLQEVPGEGFLNTGTGKRGNLYIRFDIAFPQTLSEQTRNELRSLLA